MQSNTIFDSEKLKHDYESVIGPLTDTSFPFNRIIKYLSYEEPDFSLSGFRLLSSNENERSFDYGFYLFASKEDQKNGVRIECKGNFEVDLKNQQLTLNITKVHAWEPFGRFKSQDADKITEIFSQNLKKFEIKNYNWFSRIIRIQRPVFLPQDYLDYNNYEQAEVELKLDNGLTPNSEIVSLQNKIERLRKGPVVTLPETYTYDLSDYKNTKKLCLNPDGTLDFYSTDYEWDRDGSYSWDSSLSVKGRWIFDSENKSITLKFLTFNLIEDKNPVDFLSKFAVPADIVTSPFTFEDDSIKGLYAGWFMGTLKDLGQETFKLKRKNESG